MFDPTQAPFRIHMGAEGQVISGSKKLLDDDGYAYVFEEFTGWDEPPALTTDTKARAGQHGLAAGESYQGERNLVIKGHVIVPGDDLGQLRDAIDKLFAAIPLKDELLVVHENGLVRHLYVRQGGQPTADRIGRKSGFGRIAGFSIQLVAFDARRLSGDGTGYTKSFDTEPGVAGSVTVETGRGLVPPMLFKIGPCVNPRITINGVEQWYELTVPNTALLRIDLGTKSANVNGTPVNGKMRGRWVQPDRRSTVIAFSADDYDPDTKLTVDTFDSYL